MTLVNYSQVIERFSHIDARFVGCNLTMPDGNNFFRVAIYPWWEHPSYVKAQNSGTSWRFKNLPDNAYREVTVYPRGLREARLSPLVDVIDWDFTNDHYLLWKYEGYREITCNSRLSVNEWMDVVHHVCEILGSNCSFDIINKYASFANIYRWGLSAPFLLGRFPRTLADAVCQALDNKQLRYFAGREPELVKPPVLFLIDGSDYIIAEDFEVDIPEFVHAPEWFQVPS